MLLAFLFYMDQGMGILPWGLLAGLLHEMGHYAAGRAFGGKPQWMELSAVGAQLSMAYPGPLSYGKEIIVAMAGPAVNLILGWAAAGMRLFLLAGVSFGLGMFNLLPVLPLDGGRVLWSGLALLFGESNAERVLMVTAGAVVGVIAGFAAIGAVRFANFSLLITVIWLLWICLRGKKEKKKAKNGLHLGK